MTNEELWKAALNEIELEVSRANFITWFKNTQIAENKEGVITINVPNTFIKEWLEDKYQKLILKSLRNYHQEIRNISYNIVAHANPNLNMNYLLLKKQKSAPLPETQLEFKEFQNNNETGLNHRYTLDSFIVGSFNELAHAASVAVTKNIGTLYNPLFIYGGVGLGKTHLIQATGNEIKKNNPAAKIKYVTSEKFTSEVVDAIQKNEMPAFKTKYRGYDVLIIDDVQFFSRTVQGQEQLFHTFNTLYDSNKQIILSADRPPRSIGDIEERLRSRFEGGIMTDVSEPEYESRLAILKVKSSAKNHYLLDETLEYIASSVKHNIRELEGALTLVIAKEKLIGRPLNLDQVKEILNKNTQPKKLLTATQIIKTVANYYNIEEKNLFKKTRKKEIVKPRQVAMYLLREDFNGSYPYIGQKFGGRDHTTAIHSCEKIIEDLKKDERLIEEIKKIREILYTN
ncbi:MAG: chromosomal replication initiator protein DnaA [Candidatus Niyogibacteria bacterium]|nr:chromosomal replication initiator protein DnaA [Candidatus Niyogibacteria bacterium]